MFNIGDACVFLHAFSDTCVVLDASVGRKKTLQVAFFLRTISAKNDARVAKRERFCARLRTFFRASPTQRRRDANVNVALNVHEVICPSKSNPLFLEMQTLFCSTDGRNCPLMFVMRLFELQPELIVHFHYHSVPFSSVQECLTSTEFTEHIRKVMTVIDAAVQSLDALPSLEEYLISLGKKHHAIGIPLESFNTVGESLLFALESGLGDVFTSDTHDAWSGLYAIVVSTMSRGWGKDPEEQ
ncbi:unnamed protein product [Ranitomeya imitator]|uniref:Nitrite reductase n=1 Tax=Ranitomeya imitator TaxID=111125 RepID=A0ABN9LAF5_9NEOB|nr:unnamed protein product [Ranitomeya imitator]